MKSRIFALVAVLGCCNSVTALADDNFPQCIDRLKERALQASISPRVVESTLGKVRHIPRVIELDRAQPEFVQTFHRYYNQRVTDQRVALGRELLQRHHELLNRLAQEYGVPAHYLVAFWGMETNFGQYLGKMNTLDSLATLACDERRSEFFTIELLEALQLIQQGLIEQSAMAGSWAGAMGNMQFMPSTYRRYGLDADKDGKIDMWNSLPDAFTSAAYYLSQLGWEKGWRWGREVLLPDNFDYSQAGRLKARPLEYWSGLGVTNTNGKPLPDVDKQAAILVPAGHQGPAFAVYENFHVILKWNLSEFYALSVGILADRIRGGTGLTVLPPQTPTLSVAEVKEVQSSLAKRGFNVGEVDGIFGSRTKEALRQFQRQNGMIADGFLHENVLEKLSAEYP